MNLVHICGARVCGEVENSVAGFPGSDLVMVFADAQTDDPVTHCPGCGESLAEAAARRELRLQLPTGQAAGAVKAQRKPRGAVRDAALKAIRKSIQESKQRQAARVAA
jgi:hypothetical protein